MTEKSALPAWRSHKIVRAAKIETITYRPDQENGGALIVLELPSGETANIAVDQAYIDKHKPEPNGYFVHYDNEYDSWSPAEVFQAGYTLVEGDGAEQPPAPRFHGRGVFRKKPVVVEAFQMTREHPRRASPRATYR